MKISVKNLGVLKQAEFELGDLTLICGGNNTGKTYATYALFGFLWDWERSLGVEIPDQTIDALLRDGVTQVDVEPYAMKVDDILRRRCRKYTRELRRIFASQPNRFKDASFQASLEAEKTPSIKSRDFERRIRSAKDGLLSLSKAKGEMDLVISLLMEKGKNAFPAEIIKGIISDAIVELLFDKLLPRPFIASAERTGAAIFRKDIIGGEYIAGSNDTIYFKPARRQLKLTMDESSGAVRSLLDIGFYLHHVAKPGDLLMVDEPELNLHPENQRRIARLLARLVNLDIGVFVTTHSDYIVKELNTLIMLNQDKPYLKQIAEKEGYQREELLHVDNIRVYIAEEALIKREKKSRRSRHQTLVPARIDPKLGIEADSFDKTINKMNEIQDAIVWGGDE